MPVIGAKLTEIETQKIDNLVKRGLFINRSDFIRTAIRDFLEAFKEEVIES